MDIQRQINAALAGRAAQRAFVDNLASNWNGLKESFTALISSTADLATASAIAQPPDKAHAAVFNGVGSYFAADGDWRKRAMTVSAQLGECADRVGVLQRRVHRETINIGVIGVTGAGKSTLLRKLSGLGEDHIPSNDYDFSTATPSRIFHKSGSSQDRATLNLHTWRSFREEVLIPLHRLAKLGEPVPASIEDFRHFRYPDDVPEGEAGTERYVKKLRQAQDSLPSYEAMLHGGTEQITLDQLRAFVAYPRDRSSRERPYHAVRSVEIFCQFPQVGAVSLGLVDLPGSGEAGLDVHGRFLPDLRNSTDLLFIVKRPTTSPATDPDWDLAQLADDAAAGVRRGDFAHQVINRDADLREEHFAKALARAHADSAKLGIDVQVCDIQASAPLEVTEAILLPILNHLAGRLAYMDRDAVAFVLTDLASVAAEARSLGRELARQFDSWQTSLPDEEVRRRIRIRALKNQVSRELDRVRDEYDRLFRSGEPIAELHQQIEKAGREIREWLAVGLGAGSRDAWLEAFQDAIAGKDKGDELDRQYNSARQKVVAVFGQIDPSLELAIERLYGEVAAALRRKLTEKIVPAGSDHGAVLREFVASARTDDARTLAKATERLLELRADYGSIFLRVGRPVVRKIEWDEDGEQAKSAVAAAVGHAAATVAGHAAATVAGHTASAAVSHVAGPSAGLAAEAVVRKAVSSAIGPGTGQKAEDWLPDHLPGAPAPSAPSPAEPAAPPADRSPDGAVAEPYPEAAKWHGRLTATIKSVTTELEQEFHVEAQRTLRVLAAAVDLFKDSTTTAPEIEVEYERVCSRAQREIWPAEFGEASAKVIADMAALRQQAVDAEAAAGQVASLVSQAPRLLTSHA